MIAKIQFHPPSDLQNHGLLHIVFQTKLNNLPLLALLATPGLSGKGTTPFAAKHLFLMREFQSRPVQLAHAYHLKCRRHISIQVEIEIGLHLYLRKVDQYSGFSRHIGTRSFWPTYDEYRLATHVKKDCRHLEGCDHHRVGLIFRAARCSAKPHDRRHIAVANRTSSAALRLDAH